MNNKIYYLSSCSTCKRILGGIVDISGFDLVDIKESNITAEDLDYIKETKGSYEALFSKRARKYREWKLKEKNLQEDDYRSLILKEYTFLARPVIIFNDMVFVGNAKSTVTAAQEAINGQ